VACVAARERVFYTLQWCVHLRLRTTDVQANQLENFYIFPYENAFFLNFHTNEFIGGST